MERMEMMERKRFEKRPLADIKIKTAKADGATEGTGVRPAESPASEGSFLQPNIRDVPYEMIIPNPKNRKTMENIHELADNIEREGLLSPLVVVEKNGGYMLISGERRYRAIGVLRGRSPEMEKTFKHIKCNVLEPGNDLMQDIQLIAANTTAQELTPREYREAVAIAENAFTEMLQRGDIMSENIQKMTASVFGVSDRQIRNIKAINEKLMPELQEAYDAGRISLRVAAKIAGLELSGQKKMQKLYEASGKISDDDVEDFRRIEEDKRSAEEGGAPEKKEKAQNDESRMDSALNRLERSMLNLAQKAKKNELTEDDRIRVSHVVQALTDICNDADIDIKALINSLKRGEKSSPEKSEPGDGAEEG